MQVLGLFALAMLGTLVFFAASGCCRLPVAVLVRPVLDFSRLLTVDVVCCVFPVFAE